MLLEYIIKLEPETEATCGVAQIEAGTHHHVQGAVYYRNPISFNSMQDKLARVTGGQKIAHIERMKGSYEQSVTYCTKEASKVVLPDEIVAVRWGIEAEPRQGKRSDLALATEALVSSMATGAPKESVLKQIAREFPMAFVQRHSGLAALAAHIAIPTVMQVPAEWRPWQAEVLAHIEQAPHDRAIFWVYGLEGNEGKSLLTKYLVSKGGCLLSGTVADMRYAWSVEHKVGIFDIERTHGDLKSVVQMAESLKNGMFCSSKYESGMKTFPTPHVIFFANEPPPDPCPWSRDRLVSLEILPENRRLWAYGTCSIDRLHEAEDPLAGLEADDPLRLYGI